MKHLKVPLTRKRHRLEFSTKAFFNVHENMDHLISWASVWPNMNSGPGFVDCWAKSHSTSNYSKNCKQQFKMKRTGFTTTNCLTCYICFSRKSWGWIKRNTNKKETLQVYISIKNRCTTIFNSLLEFSPFTVKEAIPIIKDKTIESQSFTNYLVKITNVFYQHKFCAHYTIYIFCL